MINSYILSIPTYYILVYPVPDSILQEITRLVRDFFWFKGGNGKGTHSITWSCITKNNTEGGLSFRNLSHDQHSLMAKDVFKFLNVDQAIWVDIMHLKYGSLNIWLDSAPPNCS